MSEQAYKKLISGETRGVIAAFARGVLSALSFPYGWLIAIRNKAFDARWKAVYSVDRPVIAIGNLTTGGTGKTPVVAAVVKMLQKQGHRPGIVSRGYGADSTGINDEKRVLEIVCPGVSHEQNPDRIAAARKLITELDVTVIVLDDAFQHRRIRRDLNIVLVDATNPFGYGRLLPRGLLREPINNLRRADMVLVTRSDQASESTLQQTENTITRQNSLLRRKISRISFEPTGLVTAAGDQQPLTMIQKKSVMVLTAIGNPEAFVDTCRQLGVTVLATHFFPDHHIYSGKELDDIVEQSKTAGGVPILTTLKDLVKIPAGYGNILAVQIEARFEAADGDGILSDELIRVTKIP